MTIRKSDIVLTLSTQMGYLRDYNRRNPKHLRVLRAINAMLEQMSVHLENGGHVEIRGFGTFTTRTYGTKTRMARNPQTGETRRKAILPRVRFKAGKELREKVNDD